MSFTRKGVGVDSVFAGPAGRNRLLFLNAEVPWRDMADMLRRVSLVTRVDAAEIKGRGRTPHVAEARHLFCEVACRGGHSTVAVGHFLGRDHSTVVHSRTFVRTLMPEDLELFLTLYNRTV